LNAFNLNRKAHSAYRLLEWQTHNPLTDLLEIHFLNLSAAQEIDVQKDPIEKQQKLINWLRFVRIHTFGADTRYEQKLPAGVLLHVED